MFLSQVRRAGPSPGLPLRKVNNMKRLIPYLLGVWYFLLTAQISFSQVTGVKLIVNTPVVDTGSAGVFVAGNFNGWKAGDTLFKMTKLEDGVYSIVLPVMVGKAYEYKYTAGNWDRVELASEDSAISNRRFVALENLEINDRVVFWKRVVPRVAPAPRAAEINARIDSLKSGLQSKMGDVASVLKKYMVNMLSDHPSKALHRKLDRRASKKVGELYMKLTGLVWDVMTKLPPEERKKLREFLQNPDAQKNFMTAFGKVMDGSAR